MAVLFPTAGGPSEDMWLYVALLLQVLVKCSTAAGASEGMWLYVSLLLQVLVKVCGCTLLYCWRVDITESVDSVCRDGTDMPYVYKHSLTSSFISRSTYSHIPSLGPATVGKRTATYLHYHLQQ